MILMNDPGKTEGLLLLLTRNLDRYGLRVESKKGLIVAQKWLAIRILYMKFFPF
jgi:hypothetical protein